MTPTETHEAKGSNHTGAATARPVSGSVPAPQPERIGVLAHDQSQMEEVRQILDLNDATRRTLSLFNGGLQTLSSVLDRNQFDLLVIHSVCQTETDLARLEQVLSDRGALPVVLLSGNVEPGFLIAAMRTGVRDVLKLPVAPDALRDAVNHIENQVVHVPTPQEKRKVVAFMAGKGGSGSTFLATNLGYALGKAGAKTALIDLNLQFGDAALFVTDRVPQSNLADVVSDNMARLDGAFLQASMCEVLPTYSVLAAPEDLERAAQVRPDQVDVLVRLAAHRYEYVILDMGRSLDAVSVKALDCADYIYLVMQQTLPFIRDAKRSYEALRGLGYGSDRLRIVVNRYQKSGEITNEDIELAVGAKVWTTVPNSYAAVSAAVNQGTPLAAFAPRDPVAKALDAMAIDLLERQESKKHGWLSGLWHHH